MNKKLVALAVAGAFALPLAAEAQTANVTLYGRANIDLEFVNGCRRATHAADVYKSANVTNPTVVRVSSNSSRFGMRGTESLGGGLNAIFQLESNVNWDTGNSPARPASRVAKPSPVCKVAGVKRHDGQVPDAAGRSCTASSVTRRR